MKTLKTKIAVIGAAAAIAVSAITGTFAWNDFSQHKTNAARNSTGATYEARLVEDFVEVTNWKTSDGAIKKEVRVTNAGKASDGFEAAYVRVQLKEYLEIAEITYTQTTELYILDSRGAFYCFATESAAQTAFPEHVVKQLTDAVTGTTGWFIQSQNGDINGQYGKPVITAITLQNAVSVVEGVTRAADLSDADHHAAPNGECSYTIHKWNGLDPVNCDNGEYDSADHGALTFHDYVKWLLGEDVISYAEFMDPIGNNSAPVAKWVYDDGTGDNGGGTDWVYWGMALQPQNDTMDNPLSTTSNLLEKIQLMIQPKGDFYYAIHVEMEAVSIDDLFGTYASWAGSGDDNRYGALDGTAQMPSGLRDSYLAAALSAGTSATPAPEPTPSPASEPAVSPTPDPDEDGGAETLDGRFRGEWVQPFGDHDAYIIGDIVTHNGFTWQCTAGDDSDSNVWEPGSSWDDGWTKIS